MSVPWHGRLRKLASSAGSVLARPLSRVHGTWTMTRRTTERLPRGGRERRVDPVSADVGPAIYRRIIAGRYRRAVRGGDPEPESVPA